MKLVQTLIKELKGCRNAHAENLKISTNKSYSPEISVTTIR